MAPWREALAWVAYRAADDHLLQEVLSDTPQQFPAFAALAASSRGDWTEALRWAELGLHGPAQVVAARYRAVALAMLGEELERWHAAFLEALALTSDLRDRGLLLLDLAHHLSGAGCEIEAKDALARAIPCFKMDDRSLALAYSNLGIICLRLRDRASAERALRRAVQVAERPEGSDYLSTAWRGLGGVYQWSGQWARAAYAFELAERKALNVIQTVATKRSRAGLLRLQGHLDEALEVLHATLLHADVPAGAPHVVNTDLAAVHVLRGDLAGAQALLEVAATADITDRWRLAVVRAELSRLAGESDFAQHLSEVNLAHVWAEQEAWVFPALFAAVGLKTAPPPWRISVDADGPIQVKINGDPLDLRPTSPEAVLLAFLVRHQGSVSVEKILEALNLAGETPRRRKQTLSKVVVRLRERLGWPGSVQSSHPLIRLSSEPQWVWQSSLSPERADDFCEGCTDPWVVEYRSERLVRSILA